MIIDLPRTTIRDINRRLIHERTAGGAVALGRVLTLIIDAGPHDPEPAIEVAKAASLEHPCRVIVLTEQNGPPGSQVDAQIRLGGDAGASEVIILRHSVEEGRHPDTLVVPLLLPDTPVVVWWPNEAPANPGDHPLGRLGVRRITDSSRCSAPVETLKRLARNYQEGDTDLAWTRTTLWRGLLAAALDEPPFEPVERVVVVGEAGHPSVDLLAAWLGFALDCPTVIRREESAPAITQVILERPSGAITLSRPDGKTASLTQPGQPEQRISLPIRPLGESLSEELRSLSPDPVYGEVLRYGLAGAAQ